LAYFQYRLNGVPSASGLRLRYTPGTVLLFEIEGIFHGLEDNVQDIEHGDGFKQRVVIERQPFFE